MADHTYTVAITGEDGEAIQLEFDAGVAHPTVSIKTGVARDSITIAIADIREILQIGERYIQANNIMEGK